MGDLIYKHTCIWPALGHPLLKKADRLMGLMEWGIGERRTVVVLGRRSGEGKAEDAVPWLPYGSHTSTFIRKLPQSSLDSENGSRGHPQLQPHFHKRSHIGALDPLCLRGHTRAWDNEGGLLTTSNPVSRKCGHWEVTLQEPVGPNHKNK